VIDSRIQNEIRHWPELKDLYEGADFFIRDSETLVSYLKSIQSKNEQEKSRIERSIAHVRKYFPDEAGKIAVQRIERALGNVEK